MGDVKIGGRLDVFHPFPAIHNGEMRALGGQNRGERGCLGVATNRPMFIGEMEPEFVLVVFNRLERGQFHIGMRTKAARVDAPRVIAGLAVHYLLGQKPTVTAAFAQTRTQADDAKRVPFAGYWPDQWRTVNGIGNRPVHDVLDTDLLESGHPGKCPFKHIGDPVQIIGAKRVGEMGVDPVHAPCFAVLFIKADQQAILFLTAIIVTDWATQQRHPVARINDAFDVFGHKILVFH